MMWILMLIGVVSALDLGALENQSVPFFQNEIINVHLEGIGDYGVIIRHGRIIEVKEGFYPDPTVKITLTQAAVEYYKELASLNIPQIEKRDKAIQYLKEHLDKEIKIEFYGWKGIFKMVLFKLYLVVV